MCSPILCHVTMLQEHTGKPFCLLYIAGVTVAITPILTDIFFSFHFQVSRSSPWVRDPADWRWCSSHANNR